MKVGTLCYIRDNGKTLMLHRVKKENDMHEGKWNGLGGKLEPGETPEECVIREVKEESGLEIKDPQLKGILTFPEFDGIEDWMVFLFTAEKYDGEQIVSNEGKLKWVPNEELKNLNLWEGDKLFMNWLDEKKFFSAKFIYENGKLLNHNVIFH